MIVQRFIEEGYYERHLNKTRAMYKGRHDTLIEELKPLLGKCKISGEHAGVHLLLTFEDGYSEQELIELAKNQISGSMECQIIGWVKKTVGKQRFFLDMPI